VLKSYEIALEIMQNAVSLEKQTASTRKFEETIQKEFVTLKTIYDHTATHLNNVHFETLSMGMSGDYALAIEKGSNLVRIGSLLFGARN
jgi:uncharacterized pyridoxal phosphate-containing UPF0001 family protein